MQHNLSKTILDTIYLKSKSDNIPYVRDETIKFIIKIINDNNYKNILEIGTAYGYSSAAISLNTNAFVTSLEKSEDRYKIAFDFLGDNPRIKLLNLDCHNFVTDNLFDLIFIDGPKAKQIAIFEQFSKFLAPNGTIIIDNMFMKKFENKDLTKNQARILSSVKELHDFLTSHKTFNCQIIDIDDGIAILKKEQICNY